MAENAENGPEALEIPVSLQRRAKEPKTQLYFNVPVSWAEELEELAREFDQNVSTFLREATEDWLQKARKVRQQQAGLAANR
jgi:hypothetical protein